MVRIMRRIYPVRFLFLCAACTVVLLIVHFYFYIYKPRQGNKEQKIVIDIFPYNALNNKKGISPVVPGMEESQKQASSSSQMFTGGTGGHNSPLPQKIVHLDLKGMPPKVEAYESLFPFFRKIGVTGILIEYEDMFPYSDRLLPISNKKAYSAQDIKGILDLAKSSHLEVIPLVQTFGHLEFVLKLEEFQQLREVPRYMQVICPTNNDSLSLVREMIDQVVNLHPEIKRFHMGSDEVYHIGKCPLCLDRMEKFKIGVTQLFLQHASTIAEYIKYKHNLQPLMWDDEFRRLDEKLIEQSGIGKLVEIVVWNYRTDVGEQVPTEVWQKYSKLFKSAWIASAFKGANSPNSVIVNESLYLSNHYSWLKVISEMTHLMNFKGAILTGWQRYDHFSVLCEILPSAIPSLTACMTLLNSPEVPTMDAVLANASSTLHCGSFMNYCSFPGSKIHEQIVQLEIQKNAIRIFEQSHVTLGWGQDVNLLFQFSNPSHVEGILNQLIPLKIELEKCQKSLEASLSLMFPSWSIEEWMLTNFYPSYDKVKHLHSGLAKILERKTFPRRPLELADTDSTLANETGNLS